MAENLNRPHIQINGFSSTENYKYPKRVVIGFPVKQRDRVTHGNKILHELTAIKEKYEIEEETQLPENIIKDDAIYVQFFSDWGYELKFEQLHDNRKGPPAYQILNVKREEHSEGDGKYRYQVVVMLTKGGISHFINKATLYLTENTKDRQGNITNKPQANELIGNIETIQLATLKAFWSDEPEIPFPNEDDIVWWEVWFRKTSTEENEEKINQNLNTVGAQIGDSRLIFPEHVIRLVKGSAKQLSESLLFLDNLAELRKPQEVSDFIRHPDLTYTEEREWLNDLITRTENASNENSVLVCLLDSGVNNQHPLLNPFLPDNRLYTWIDDWGKYDSEPFAGHGTGMAGLVLYGDITDALTSSHKIKLFHGLESFKVYHPSSPSNKELYGVITEKACSSPIVNNPNNLRVFCLSVTNKDFVFDGRPSSSSASVDRIAFGDIYDPAAPQLIFISGGNVRISKHTDYPDKNFYESIQDPGQSYNAITVGSYTRKDKIDVEKFPGWQSVAAYGAMAPSNSTSTTWETQWPNKPDIVMEGGNLAYNLEDTDHNDRLQLVTTHRDFRSKTFGSFGDTSAAVALASKMAAELRTNYPNYWPETIRGLIIHSAEWTDAMLESRNLNNEGDRRALLRSVGYGVPILRKALYSATNSLTLISERIIQPYRIEKSQAKYNQYHLFNLPWPAEVLKDEIGDRDVTLKVTLSYYIEPNPGNRQYANN